MKDYKVGKQNGVLNLSQINMKENMQKLKRRIAKNQQKIAEIQEENKSLFKQLAELGKQKKLIS